MYLYFLKAIIKGLPRNQIVNLSTVYQELGKLETPRRRRRHKIRFRGSKKKNNHSMLLQIHNVINKYCSFESAFICIFKIPRKPIDVNHFHNSITINILDKLHSATFAH